jgi:hypothetical protein
VVEINEAGIGDHRLCGVSHETFDRPGGFVNVPVAECDEVFLSPPLLLGGYPELSTGNAGGLVNCSHQLLVRGIVFRGERGESGLTELCDRGGCTEYRKSLILSRGRLR